MNAFLSNPTEYASTMRNVGDAQGRDNLELVLECFERRISVRNEDGSQLSRSNVERRSFSRNGIAIEALLEAAKYEDVDDVKIIDYAGISFNSKDSRGRITLHMATTNGCLDVVEFLISSGMGLNACNMEKYTLWVLQLRDFCTKIIIHATQTQNVLCKKGKKISELTSVIQKRFEFLENNVELYAEKFNNRVFCAIAQVESLRFKLLRGLAI